MGWARRFLHGVPVLLGEQHQQPAENEASHHVAFCQIFPLVAVYLRPLLSDVRSSGFLYEVSEPESDLELELAT